ncbi:ABC transporter substrate-binding protein [Bacillus sp. ISL-46]|uniref:ABC transporter substrate-binding protein n=1 Tax=Bacillus sp. ISL-46 TaxID=2819129 RepID=UPI001BE7F0EA|nr:ABC transporter substrate-binding protein [Bacillus sp. ISL-46]MBT2721154.1 ABC transporter substrate-binding protein [Bacillus sp. ISL-46]
MKKNYAFLSLVISIFILLTACSNTTTSSDENKKDQTDNKNSETTELTMAFLAFGPPPKDLELVQNEINKLTKEKINATVKLLPINASQYTQQTNLMLSSKEKLDLLITGNIPGFLDYSGQSVRGQLHPLDELIEKHGEGIANALGSQFIGVSKIGGKTYGIPTVRDLAGDRSLIMRKDLVDKYNIDISKIKSLDDVEAVLKTIKENEPNVSPLMPGQVGTATVVDGVNLPDGDLLGDGVGVLLDSSKLEVSNYYKSDEYSELLKIARKWYKAGYILPGAATNKESAESLMKAKKIFSFIQSSKPGIEGQVSKGVGAEVVSVPLTPVTTNTQKVTGFMWAVPQHAENPEKSVEFLNLLYSDKDLVNLIDWGIEGKHYVKADDGLIDYPADFDANSTGYALNSGFQFGNQFLSYVWKGDSPDIWKEMDSFNKTAKASQALGFLFDSSPVKTEVAAVSNVTNQFKGALENGMVDPKTELPKFEEKLKAAGIDKIIQEKQKQLDKWAKENK